MRIGCVGYATRQGLGYLVKDFYDHGIIDEVAVVRHPSYENHPEWYPDEFVRLKSKPFRRELDAFLRRIDVLLCFETPFDWSLLPYCKELGVKTVCVPMYEWFPVNPPHHFDKYICPSKLDQQYFPDNPFLPVPVDPSSWTLRNRAERFLHNAGHIGHRNHKGTEELIKAVPFLRPEINLTIRSQTSRIHSLLDKIDREAVKCQLSLHVGEIPREQLFDDHDVYVAPEKFNGLSLPLQEARAAGLLVMTTDRFPANDWLPREPLISPTAIHTACIGGGYHQFKECIVDPETIADRMNSWYGQDISEYSLDGWEWAESHSWDSLRGVWLEELSR